MCTMANYEVPSEVRTVTEENPLGLLPGFRFHPTDEEIIVHYLMPKVMNSNFSAVAIGQVDFNKCEPWELPKIANAGDTEERYYYCLRDKKYPTGLRTNRATKVGYWKATGKDRDIVMGNSDPKVAVGMKKTLVFYKGRAPTGEKTNWVMHEFRLHPHFDQMPKNNYGWVVSRVFHKNADGSGMPKRTYAHSNISFSPNQGSDDSFTSGHELIKDIEYESLPPLIDSSAEAALPPPNASNNQLQDLKPTDVWYPKSSTFDAYGEDELLYAGDPSYYYPKLPETLLETIGTYGPEQPEVDTYNADDGSVMESFNCKVEQHFALNSAGIGFSSNGAEITGLYGMMNIDNNMGNMSYNNNNVGYQQLPPNDRDFNGLLLSKHGTNAGHVK